MYLNIVPTFITWVSVIKFYLASNESNFLSWRPIYAIISDDPRLGFELYLFVNEHLCMR